MADHRFSAVSRGKSCCNISKKAQICLCLVFGLLVVVIIAVVVGILMWHQPPKHKEWKGAGTTAHFYEIILGRCYTYTQIVRPELGHKDCSKIGKAFTNAFLSKDPCSSTEQDYQPLMELTNQTVPCNKTLLWSKTRDLVHDYAWVQPDLFTLEDTLLGYMADGLTWCGDPGSNEMNYQSCPDWRKDCSNNSVSIFWNTVSKRFAGDACGVVHVLLNGSIRNTFDEKSTFGRVEVFNLHPEKVHMLQAWVVQDIRTISSNSCSNSSIKDLEAILSKRNITFTCQDNYRPIRLLQCVKDPEHSSCRSEI
ncbi:ADP-ribosyl cyclase/cyclic ADP-ribose hydrolase 1 isoform X2 [Suricata suricatta]|nr:ADP-ribosyl cyclase/cyclic ADP-ribose hydrolase 1 isoform X2 [Suricata suricatta]XP_029804376.1 ADP-ribosyl cyclase/cyclic ADP-ribose hydrolase 1 isoform X2 [Suricata suricatta]